jgi:hypothetical protein
MLENIGRHAFRPATIRTATGADVRPAATLARGELLMSSATLSKLIRSVSTVLVLLLWPSGDAVAQREPDFTGALNVAKVSAPLTEEERTLAVSLAEQALKSNRLFTDRRMYLTEARIHRDSASEGRGVFERMAVLTYYRYEGDLSLQVFINLAGRRVFGVNTTAPL